MEWVRCWKRLSRFELLLWSGSVSGVLVSFLLTPRRDPLTLIASLIGVTALLFVAKGMVVGQILTVVFAVLYGILSFGSRYYGEMLTYLGMTSPMAILAAVEWARNPYRDSGEVTVRPLSAGRVAGMAVLTAGVTVLFYFPLAYWDTAQLGWSTVSVATSFIASALTFLRSPYYALGYAANDLVLIVLWSLSARQDPASLPMILCFVLFLANDLYGFCSWKRMQKRQTADGDGDPRPSTG